MRRWSRGDQIVLREVWRGRVWAARPVTVVEDAPGHVALYLAPGTRLRLPHGPDGTPLRLQAEEWHLNEVQWTGGGLLYLVRPEDAHAVLGFWTRGHEALAMWYINLQEPLRRTEIGFDYLDQALDVVVQPDLSTWKWKDEDELEEAVRRGIVTASEARAIRAEGERALRLLLMREPPLDRGWERWSPDPAWPIPALPSGWERVAPCEGAARAGQETGA